MSAAMITGMETSNHSLGQRFIGALSAAGEWFESGINDCFEKNNTGATITLAAVGATIGAITAPTALLGSALAGGATTIAAMALLGCAGGGLAAITVIPAVCAGMGAVDGFINPSNYTK